MTIVCQFQPRHAIRRPADERISQVLNLDREVRWHCLVNKDIVWHVTSYKYAFFRVSFLHFWSVKDLSISVQSHPKTSISLYLFALVRLASDTKIDGVFKSWIWYEQTRYGGDILLMFVAFWSNLVLLTPHFHRGANVGELDSASLSAIICLLTLTLLVFLNQKSSIAVSKVIHAVLINLINLNFARRVFHFFFGFSKLNEGTTVMRTHQYRCELIFILSVRICLNVPFRYYWPQGHRLGVYVVHNSDAR